MQIVHIFLSTHGIVIYLFFHFKFLCTVESYTKYKCCIGQQKNVLENILEGTYPSTLFENDHKLKLFMYKRNLEVWFIKP